MKQNPKYVHVINVINVIGAAEPKIKSTTELLKLSKQGNFS